MRVESARIVSISGVALILALIFALTIVFLLASHVGAGHAVAAHGQQLASVCVAVPGPCTPTL